MLKKGEIACYEQFLLSHTVFKRPALQTLINIRANLGMGLFLSQTSPGFYMSAVASLLKTLLEKVELLVTSNSSFTTVFSTCLKNILPFSSSLKLSSANFISLVLFGRVENLLFGEGLLELFSLFAVLLFAARHGDWCIGGCTWVYFCLTHYQTTNFRLFQTETVCRRQFQI